MNAKTLAETLVAMANHQGGTLVLPVDGSTRTPALIDRVLQAALASDPPLILPLPKETAVDGAPVVIVTVPAGLPHVYALEGRYLTRDGTVNRPLPPRQLRRLLIERGELSYEEELAAGATRDDLDWTAIAAYVARLGVPDSENLMIRRGCLMLCDGELRPTNAGILLFGKDPQRFRARRTDHGGSFCRRRNERSLYAGGHRRHTSRSNPPCRNVLDRSFATRCPAWRHDGAR